MGSQYWFNRYEQNLNKAADMGLNEHDAEAYASRNASKQEQMYYEYLAELKIHGAADE